MVMWGGGGRHVRALLAVTTSLETEWQ